MMRRDEFLRNHPEVKPDMTAFSDDGEKLGPVTSLNEESIDIAKGDFFPRDFAVRYDDVEDIHDSELIINKKRKELKAWQDENYEGWDEIRSLNEGQEYDITLHGEEIEAQVTGRHVGQVRLRKVVHTEEKTFTIPVAREDVIVERLDADESLETGEEGEVFKEEDITIPVMEEEIEIVKHWRVKGRVHARKVTHVEQQEMSGMIRSEEVEVIRDEPGSQKEQELQEEEE